MSAHPAAVAMPGAGASAASTRPAFTSIINLLLGPQRPPADDAGTADDSDNPETSSATSPLPQAAPAAALPVAVSPVPASQLADAMIRSMFASSANVAALTASGKSPSRPAKSGPVANSSPTASTAAPGLTGAQTAPLVPSAVMAMTQAPLMRSADTLRPAGAVVKSTSSKLPFGATVVPAASKPAAPAPLAFSMRIIPAAEPVTPASSSNPAPEAAQPEPTPATPQETLAIDPQPQPEAAPEPNSETSKPSAAPGATEVETKVRQDAQAHADAVPAVAAAATTTDGSDDFARQMPAAIANVTPVPTGAKTQVPPAPSAAQALRTSEPASPSAPAQPAAAVKEIAVRIATPQAPAVDVHLTERAGQLHVAVRTADGGLQTSLRQDLGSLVNSLERSGYRAEAFTPREGSLAAAASAQTNSQNGRQESESGSGGRNGNSGDTPRTPAAASSSSGAIRANRSGLKNWRTDHEYVPRESEHAGFKSGQQLLILELRDIQRQRAKRD